MNKPNMKPFAKCACGADLFNDKVEWLKKVMIFPSSILKLYNCPHCNSTRAIKVSRESAPSQATSLYDRGAA